MALFAADKIVIETEEIPGSKYFRLRVLVRRRDTGEWSNILRTSFDGMVTFAPGDALNIMMEDPSGGKLTFEPRPDLDERWRKK